MSAPPDAFEQALRVAAAKAHEWLDSLTDRPVPAAASVDEITAALGTELPDEPTDAAQVVDLLATSAEPGLVAMPSGRFFGLVIGGSLPAALAADWLVSAWDQNAVMAAASPASAAIEEVASGWLLDLLGLPSDAAVGFATGATMANFACLAAARDAVLGRRGWDVRQSGLTGAPPVRILVGAERHDTVDLALHYLGLGAPEPVAADDQGRLRADALAEALATDSDRPVIVCLQAGNVHSGASDPFADAIEASRSAGAWVHVDGAFGLWAAASPRTRWLTAGMEGADSWATDAHKTLNVPYDSGLAIVRDPAALRASMSYHGDYLITDENRLESYERVPESSRRARAVPVWAALRSLGRSGIADMVDRFCRHAAALAEGARDIPGAEILNDVDFTQVCLAFGSDERTREIGRRLMADGTVWMSGSHWHGRAVLRISVSNWSTDEDDVARSLEALRRAVEDEPSASAAS